MKENVAREVTDLKLDVLFLLIKLHALVDKNNGFAQFIMYTNCRNTMK
jgi:hypothetical protein